MATYVLVEIKHIPEASGVPKPGAPINFHKWVLLYLYDSFLQLTRSAGEEALDPEQPVYAPDYYTHESKIWI